MIFKIYMIGPENHVNPVNLVNPVQGSRWETALGLLSVLELPAVAQSQVLRSASVPAMLALSGCYWHSRFHSR